MWAVCCNCSYICNFIVPPDSSYIHTYMRIHIYICPTSQSHSNAPTAVVVFVVVPVIVFVFEPWVSFKKFHLWLSLIVKGFRKLLAPASSTRTYVCMYVHVCTNIDANLPAVSMNDEEDTVRLTSACAAYTATSNPPLWSLHSCNR